MEKNELSYLIFESNLDSTRDSLEFGSLSDNDINYEPDLMYIII